MNYDPLLDCSDEGSSDVVRVAANAVANHFGDKAKYLIEQVAKLAESPIEKAMLCALVVAAHESVESVQVSTEVGILGDSPCEAGTLLIEPQKELCGYRVDVLLTYVADVPDFEHPVNAPDGLETPGCKTGAVRLVVECDGHDFHEKTKQQVSGDKRRDRELKMAGYEVFRYSGSDIWKDPLRHAREVIEHLEAEAWRR